MPDPAVLPGVPAAQAGSTPGQSAVGQTAPGQPIIGLEPGPPPPAAAPAGPAVPVAAPAVGPDEVALTIDDRPVVAKKGMTVLQAAEKAGILVPHYCYHPGLSIAGNCRMCLVEIEKAPKLQIGCATAVAPGMVVKTATPKVKTAREGIMEFLLINHPLDCPICDQAGECRLQQYSASYGRGLSRFVEDKVHFPKRYDIGRSIVFDAERCIKCTRCIRFCDEVTGTRELTLVDRGDHSIIGTFPGRPLDNDYSGCTADVCPVGALTWKPFRFKTRVWFLKNQPSVCAGCARGCNVDLASYRNRIHRMTPRINPEVNKYWMCDYGRETYAELYARPRLVRPLVRDGAGAAVPSGWPEAIDKAAGLLETVRGRSGAASIAAVVSARMSVEDLHLARRVLDGLGVTRVAVPPHEAGQDDGLLLRRDKTSNARGARLLGFGAPDAAAVEAILADAAAGRIKGLLVLGEDVLGAMMAKNGRLDEVRGGLEALVVADWWKSPTAAAADVALPVCGYGEWDGVLVNFEGRAQRARSAVKPPVETEPMWSALRLLAQRLGVPAESRSSEKVFDEVAAQVPAFAGLSYRALGRLGVRLPEA